MISSSDVQPRKMSTSDHTDRPALIGAAAQTTFNICCALLVAAIVKRWFHYHRRTPKLPSVGFWPIPYVGSWAAAIKFMLDPVAAVKRGITTTNNGLFRIATLSDEFIVVANKEQVAEYLKAPDSVLSMQDGANDVRLSSLFTPAFSEQLTLGLSNNKLHSLWAME